jgi:hypothetical protein
LASHRNITCSASLDGASDARATMRPRTRELSPVHTEKPPLKAKVEEAADAVRTERAEKNANAVRGFTETMYAAKSWTIERRVAARIEATPLGLDIRYVVTSLKTGAPEWLYAELYCARGQAENLIKLHKT